MREYRNMGLEAYTSGNAARNLAGTRYSAVPKGHPVVPVPGRARKPETRTDSHVYKNRQKALQMNGAYALFLVVAVIFCLVMCVQYLNAEAKISEKTIALNHLNSEIAELTVQNDAIDYDINSFIDIENIRKVAKQKLGMVEATGDQVTVYDKSNGEYMKQMGNIPS